MKLGKLTRRRLFAGEAVELPLADLGPVRQDGVYVVHTEKGKSQGKFRVLVIRRDKAVIRYEGDPVRLLARDGGGGDEDGRPYTDFEGRAMSEEPEAVDFHTQKRFTKEAEARAVDRDQRAKLLRERMSLEARIGLARKVAASKQIDVSANVRTIQNQLRSIERQIDGLEREAA